MLGEIGGEPMNASRLRLRAPTLASVALERKWFRPFEELPPWQPTSAGYWRERTLAFCNGDAKGTSRSLCAKRGRFSAERPRTSRWYSRRERASSDLGTYDAPDTAACTDRRKICSRSASSSAVMFRLGTR